MAVHTYRIFKDDEVEPIVICTDAGGYFALIADGIRQVAEWNVKQEPIAAPPVFPPVSEG